MKWKNVLLQRMKGGFNVISGVVAGSNAVACNNIVLGDIVANQISNPPHLVMESLCEGQSAVVSSGAPPGWSLSLGCSSFS
jgi:hypothetical protein